MKYPKRVAVLILSLLMCFSLSISTFAEGGVDACQHDWSGWYYAYEEDVPTCGYSGIQTRYCHNCDKEETKSVPATGAHEWSGWYYANYDDEPTCGYGGIKTRYCYNCDKEQTKKVAATGAHDWDSWETVSAATIFKKGKKIRECWECGKTQSKATAKIKPFARFGKKSYSIASKKSFNLKNKLKFGKGDKIKSWKTSNKKIATISKSGVIKAKKKGTVKITVKLKSGKVATCKVKVTKAKKASSPKVYWVPNGKVYHCTKSCSTLSRSKVIKSGSLSKCPKPRPCKVCY